jgi:hypothetical protein
VKAKKEKHLANLDKQDAQDQFEITITKWKKMSKYVMSLGSTIHFKMDQCARMNVVPYLETLKNLQLHGNYWT